ncbi:hypothetical protein D5086_016162 [Populus alba]|uniref:Uncharacterized protein n=1 Tax=Populus alba TaxID=43335 RepID=A0ACC4BTV4_POPAL
MSELLEAVFVASFIHLHRWTEKWKQHLTWWSLVCSDVLSAPAAVLEVEEHVSEIPVVVESEKPSIGKKRSGVSENLTPFTWLQIRRQLDLTNTAITKREFV